MSNEIAIFHDYFAIRGGGERVALELAQTYEGCTLFLGYRTAESYEDMTFPENSISLELKPILRRFGLHLPALAFKFYQKRTSAASFSVRIFSGVAAPLAVPRQGGVNIFYCHTPPRFLFDQRDWFLRDAGLLRRLGMWVFERCYRRAISRMDVIVANSENTRARIERYLGCESVVVHPPIDTRRFTWHGQGDYYLSTARLTSLKRVDRIIDAFSSMPHKKLIVASGGEELEDLKRRAKKAPNIEFRGWVSDEELRALVGNAIATIYIPVEEDFGMSPVESMAAGKPVIGVAEGGLLETIVPESTGFLLEPEFQTEDIVKAVQLMTAEKAVSMRAACEKRAKQFSKEKFILEMSYLVGAVTRVDDNSTHLTSIRSTKPMRRHD